MQTIIPGADRHPYREFLRRAYAQAGSSPDPSTQNGSVLVNTNGLVIGRGFNRFARGVAATPGRLADRGEKYPRTVHAERAAIYGAVADGYHVPGSTLFACWYACEGCAQAIIECGVARVVGHARHPGVAEPGDRWRAAVARGLEMLAEAGVATELYDGDVGGPAIRFDGKEYRP